MSKQLQYESLRTAVQGGDPNQIMDATNIVCESIRSGEIKPEDVSLRGLAKSFLGGDYVERVTSNRRSGGVMFSTEAAGPAPMDVAAFTHTTGQILIVKLLDSFKQAESKVMSLIDVEETNLETERWVGHSNISEREDEVHAGMPYDYVEFGEQWIDTDRARKVGNAIALTEEDVLFDRTGRILKQAQSLGGMLGRQRARAIWKTIFGIGITNKAGTAEYKYYKYKGNNYDIWSPDGTPEPYTNLITANANPLTSYKAIETAEALLYEMTDPETGLRLDIDLDNIKIVVMPPKRYSARRALTESMATLTVPGFTTSGNPLKSESPSPINSGGKFSFAMENIYDSDNLCYDTLRTNAATLGLTAANTPDNWLIGDFKKAFIWRELTPMKVKTLSAGSMYDFERDIVTAFRFYYRGNPQCVNPRYVIWNQCS